MSTGMPQQPATPCFVQRDATGQVVGLLLREPSAQERAAGPWETAQIDQPEVLAFQSRLTHAQDEANPLADTDASIARVTEDLIDVLIDRGVIQFTDLPQGAQAKLLRRRQTRERWANRLNLLGEDDII